jgi:hypothetical protein
MVTLTTMQHIRYFGSRKFEEEHKLKVSDKRMLRKTFELKKNEARRKWRRIHTVKLYDF